MWQKIRSAFVEDTNPAAPAPSPVATGPVLVQPISVMDDDEWYQRLAAASAFVLTTPGKAIQRYTDAMAALPLDATMKLKTAAVQAKSLEGLTNEGILAAFDGMKGALAQERTHFEEAIAAATVNEVDQPKAEIEKLSAEINAKQAEIAALQARVSDLSTGVAESQGKIVRAKSQFDMAATRRNGEIDAEKARLVALLG